MRSALRQAPQSIVRSEFRLSNAILRCAAVARRSVLCIQLTSIEGSELSPSGEWLARAQRWLCSERQTARLHPANAAALRNKSWRSIVANEVDAQASNAGKR